MLRIKIEDKEYNYYSDLSINLTYDKVASTFSISCLVDPDNKELLQLYKPLSYSKVEIFETEELIFTGVMLSHNVTKDKSQNTLTVTGYSTSGITQDCQIPITAYPLEDNGKTLRQICKKICDSLNVKLFVNQIARVEADKIYDKAQASNTETAQSYISKLAAQRDLIVGNTRQGELLLTKLRLNEAYVGNYVEGQYGIIDIGFQANGQSLHSECTVLNQSNESQFKATRELAKFRPMVKTSKDGDNDDASTAAKSALKTESNALSYKLLIKAHRYLNGTVMKPNRRLTLLAPSVFLNEPTVLFVDDVVLSETKEGGEFAELTLIPLENI